MQNDPRANSQSLDSPGQLKEFHAQLMAVMHGMGLMEDLRKAGLTDDSDLKAKQQAGAGAVPKPDDNLAPNIKSVPQPDR
ncbi:MAG: hypothetical protein EBR88_00310 [Betaproteobacteria bacterium]|nr:hypothetical protein [Betaproteobacteria bacterium]